MVIKYNKNQKMETLIILLCISLFIVILRVCREIYYDRSTAINYARTIYLMMMIITENIYIIRFVFNKNI